MGLTHCYKTEVFFKFIFKKSHKVVTFRLFGEKPPHRTDLNQNLQGGHLADVITYAKFQDDIFRGYDFTERRISHFPIDFCMGLTTVQRRLRCL